MIILEIHAYVKYMPFILKINHGIVLSKLWERIIVPLDRRFVVYPGVAGVDEGAGVEDVKHEVPLQHRPLLHWQPA